MFLQVFYSIQALTLLKCEAKDLTLCYLPVVLLAIPRKQWMLGLGPPMTKKGFYIFLMVERKSKEDYFDDAWK